MITKKDYKTIAEVIRIEYTIFDDTSEDDSEGQNAIRDVALRLAVCLAKDNLRFDKTKFLIACGFASAHKRIISCPICFKD